MKTCVFRQLFKGLILTALSINSNAMFFSPFGMYRDRANDGIQNFFHTIPKIQFTFDDITAMYRNVTAEANTLQCSGICRTPIALWVIQSLISCHNIKKVDCPDGLVCCILDSKSEALITSASKISQSNVSNMSSLENEVDPLTFVQDPIPGDSEESTTSNDTI